MPYPPLLEHILDSAEVKAPSPRQGGFGPISCPPARNSPHLAQIPRCRPASSGRGGRHARVRLTSLQIRHCGTGKCPVGGRATPCPPRPPPRPQIGTRALPVASGRSHLAPETGKTRTSRIPLPGPRQPGQRIGAPRLPQRPDPLLAAHSPGLIMRASRSPTLGTGNFARQPEAQDHDGSQSQAKTDDLQR